MANPLQIANVKIKKISEYDKYQIQPNNELNIQTILNRKWSKTEIFDAVINSGQLTSDDLERIDCEAFKSYMFKEIWNKHSVYLNHRLKD